MALTMPLVWMLDYAPAPSYSRADLLRYEAFSPLVQVDRRVALIGSCEISLPYVGNDLDLPGIPARSVEAVWLGNVINFVLRNEYRGGDRIGFFDISAPNTNIAQHTALLYHALDMPDLAAIIYVNGLTIGHNMGPDDTLETVAVLDALERRYPSAAPAVRDYRDLLTGSAEFKEGERRWGADWRRLVNRDTLVFAAPGADTQQSRENSYAVDAVWQAKLQFFLARGKKVVERVVGGPAVLIKWMFDLTGLKNRIRDDELRRELDWAARFHDRPESQGVVGVVAGSSYLQGVLAEHNRRWLVMAAELAKAKGTRLVIYAQPMLSVPADLHRIEFKPRYTDQAAAWLADYAPVIIDQTIDHDLDQRDFVLSCPNHQATCDPSEYSVIGYYANGIGRFKQARMLIESLRDSGLLPVAPQEGAVAWRGVAGLQHVSRCIRYDDNPATCRPW